VSFDRVGESTTIHSAIEAFLRNNDLDGSPYAQPIYDCNNHTDI